MKIKVSELIGPALDYAVAKCEGWKWRKCGGKHPIENYSPSTNPAQAYPIIEREKICVMCPATGDFWDARMSSFGSEYHRGPTLLIAAMRCFVSSRLGDEVEIPEELL